MHFSADRGSNYYFPQHITPTDLKPDIVWWDDEKNLLRIVELTIPFETTILLDDAAERKETKYEDLIQNAQQTGYTTPKMNCTSSSLISRRLGIEKSENESR